MSRQGDAASGSGDETSTEWEAETEDEDEAGGRAVWDSMDDESPTGIYISSVSERLAFLEYCLHAVTLPTFWTRH